MAGLPRPKPDQEPPQIRRLQLCPPDEMEVAVIAELPQRLLLSPRTGSANWIEETREALSSRRDDVALNFSSAPTDRNADARTQTRSDRRQSRRADDGSGAGRARQVKEEADAKFMADAALYSQAE